MCEVSLVVAIGAGAVRAQPQCAVPRGAHGLHGVLPRSGRELQQRDLPRSKLAGFAVVAPHPDAALGIGEEGHGADLGRQAGLDGTTPAFARLPHIDPGAV